MAQTHQQLLQQLASLSGSFPTLGARLSQAAAELEKTGAPPPQTLLQELTGYCRDFGQLRDKSLELAKGSPVAAGEITSLQELKNLIDASNSSTDEMAKAVTILERVGAIAHQDDPNFPPLQPLKAKAEELKQSITNGQLNPEAKAVAEGTHPLVAVLTLVEQQEDLDDDRWLALEEKVAASFGKKLVVAISRGKLKVSNRNLPPSPKLAGPQIKLPSLEELEKPEAPPQVAAEKPSQELPPLIMVPSGGGRTQVKATEDPDVMILEDPADDEDFDETIILPGLQVSKLSSPAQEGGASVGLKVLVHLQGIGDRTFSSYEYAGTRGQGLRVEGFQINLDPPRTGLSLQYMAHISEVGDTSWLEEGELAGDRGRERRIEGFAIRLTGAEAAGYDVFYTAHIQNMGDSAVYSNGQYCGTRGKSLRVEGLKVWIQPKANG
ncbi:MAG: hypothetical protein SXA11_14595 [Cyanobacteriota bacterium]|nr:hypothetical protein [Cyanobacteriota bacterium]